MKWLRQIAAQHLQVQIVGNAIKEEIKYNGTKDDKGDGIHKNLTIGQYSVVSCLWEVLIDHLLSCQLKLKYAT